VGNKYIGYLLPDVGTNMQRLYAEMAVPTEHMDQMDQTASAQRTLVERAVRGAICQWRKTFPPIPEAKRKWPQDFTRVEKAKLRKLAKTTMKEEAEIWKRAVEGGKLEESIVRPASGFFAF
jgi:hypothetical protein